MTSDSENPAAENSGVDSAPASHPLPAQQTPKAGGKAKASKGKGRAPEVKGQRRVGKKRQSR